MMGFSMAQTLIMAPALFDGGRFGQFLLAAWDQLRSRSVSPAETPSSPGAQASATAARPDAATTARFEQTILPHLDAAHNLARYLSRDADAAQDIVQEAFLRAFRSFGDFRGDSSRAWILTIVRNCHHDWWLQRKR